MEVDQVFMNEALALARRGLDLDEMPVGAVVVLDGEVLASACWQYQPDGLLDHADVMALRGAERDARIHGNRRRATLYVTLEPCLMCMGAAMSFGVGRVVFALEAPMDGASNVLERWRPELGFPPRDFQFFSVPQVVGGVGRAESLELMESYVERHPEHGWLQAMLPGFSYPTT